MSKVVAVVNNETMNEILGAAVATLNAMVDGIEEVPPEHQDFVREFVRTHVEGYRARVDFLHQIYQWEEKEVEEDGD